MIISNRYTDYYNHATLADLTLSTLRTYTMDYHN